MIPRGLDKETRATPCWTRTTTRCRTSVLSRIPLRATAAVGIFPHPQKLDFGRCSGPSDGHFQDEIIDPSLRSYSAVAVFMGSLLS